jgi:WD40 repeat protein
MRAFGTLWDLRTNRKMSDLFTYGFAFEPRERFYASFARRQPGVTILRLAEGAEPTTFLEDAMVQCLAIDPTGNLLACGCLQGDASLVRLIQSADGQDRGTVTLPEARDGNGPPGPTSLAFSGNGEVLAIGLSDARILRVNVSSQQVTETHRFSGSESLGGLAWIGTREALLYASSYDPDGNVTSACWKSGSPDPVWKAEGVIASDVRRMLAAWANRDGDVVLADAKTGAKLRQLRPFGDGKRWR